MSGADIHSNLVEAQWKPAMRPYRLGRRLRVRRFLLRNLEVIVASLALGLALGAVAWQFGPAWFTWIFGPVR